MPLNADWHRAHRMPRNAKPAERLAWHLEHARECGCRPLTPEFLADLQAAAASAPAARPPAPVPAPLPADRDARTFARGLPEVTEGPHFDLWSFRVGGRIFATCPRDGAELRVFVDEDGVRRAVAGHPEAIHELWWGKRLAGVRVDLDRAPPDVVEALLLDAWRRKAPARLRSARTPG